MVPPFWTGFWIFLAGGAEDLLARTLRRPQLCEGAARCDRQGACVHARVGTGVRWIRTGNIGNAGIEYPSQVSKKVSVPARGVAVHPRGGNVILAVPRATMRSLAPRHFVRVAIIAHGQKDTGIRQVIII